MIRWPMLLLLIFVLGTTERSMAGNLRVPSQCVNQLIAGSGVPAGIATARLEKSLFVKTCKGDHAQLEITGKQVKFVVVEANQIPSRQLPPRLQNKPKGRFLAELPDGEMSSSKNFKAVWLIDPTTRYDHGILGDATEAGGIAVEDNSGKIFGFKIGKNSVIEDRHVRIADLDGDGREEFITVRTRLASGASLMVLGLRDGRIQRLAETKPIGLSHRWLNPATVGDVDGDGEVEISYVETPHIGGTLRVFALRGKKLVEKYAISGVSNHAIGSRVQDMAALADWDGDGTPDIVIPNARRNGLVVFSFAGKKTRLIEKISSNGTITSSVISADLNGDGRPEVYFARKDGQLIALQPGEK